MRALVGARCVPPGATPLYRDEVEKFSVAWHKLGLAVPMDYLNEDARPTDQVSRDYLRVRGLGDGSTLNGVVPLSLRARGEVSNVESHASASSLRT